MHIPILRKTAWIVFGPTWLDFPENDSIGAVIL